jgi:V/A-type H+/Na+-transporting ATPase subunit B
VTNPAPIEYTSISSVRGPLLMVDGVREVGWDEVARIMLPGGEIRHGVVLDVSRDLAVVEVYEGTTGLTPSAVRVTFDGSPLQIAVGEQWLGRICNGRGEPKDGGPPVFAPTRSTVAGTPINPASRATPRDAITTGVSVIDGLATLVRGQKLPIFSVGGLPHLEMATQIASQASAGGEPFAVVFAAMGITHADASMVTDGLEERAAAGDLTLFLNTADDPIVERILTPRIALTVAEHLAFVEGRHVLVVMADMTSYCEAVREVAAARGETPSRRGYPGYLYSDLASLYERAGRIRGRRGSVTQIPVLTMPAGDITHPVPDLTGYITEGQLVLSQDRHIRGLYPPFEPLQSLSRLMRLGAGPGRTRDDHLEIAAQLYALAAEARRSADLADLVGEDALSDDDRALLRFGAALDATFIAQGRSEARTLDQTLDRAWQVASTLPRRRLSLSEQLLDLHYHGDLDAAANPPR